MAELPHITVQVLPVYPGEYVAIGGPLTILRFIQHEVSDVTYLQYRATALCLDRDEDVGPYRTLMDRLCVLAIPPAETIKYLNAILTSPGWLTGKHTPYI